MATSSPASITLDIALRPHTLDDLPFGTSWLPDARHGVDLAAFGYIEEEFELSGVAGEWEYDDAFAPRVKQQIPFVTRILLRRPSDPARFSGSVQLEPLHPDLDNAPTWKAAHGWMLRNGHAWVGVTQSAPVAADLAERFPDRYGRLSLPAAGLGHDILGAVAVALKDGAFPLAGVELVTMSGWSITGSFCRVYLQEGFVERHRTADGRRGVDAMIIGKTSGAFLRAGYPPLSAQCEVLPADDARRTVRGRIPVFEVLTESEAETHAPVLRDDSDDEGDRYRLYEVAGTSHRQLRPDDVLTNTAQYAEAGGELADTRITELPSDARFELFAGAAFENLERWVRDGIAPPRVPRFERTEDGALARDADGTVIGGIRPPWIAVPTARYRPSSTPAPGACLPLARFPGTGTPEQSASLIGHRIPFTAAELAARYRDADDFRARVAAHCAELVDARLMLRDDAERAVADVAYPGASA